MAAIDYATRRTKVIPQLSGFSATFGNRVPPSKRKWIKPTAMMIGIDTQQGSARLSVSLFGGKADMTFCGANGQF
jgi:hypothetical protein